MGAPLCAAPHLTFADHHRSAIVTVSSGSGAERLVEVYPTGRRRRGHSVVDSPSLPSSSGSRGYSSSTSSEGWSQVEALDEDVIEPIDSASQSRVRPSRRHTTEARPAPASRHSSRRVVQEREEVPRRRSSRREPSSRHRRTESRRTPSDESVSVASYDDYPPYGHHGAQQPPRSAYPAQQAGYRQGPQPGYGGYPPSVTSAPPYHDAYAAHQQALVQMPPPDAFGYPQQPNPFSPHSQHPNPFSPMSSASGAGGYFNTDPHAPLPPSTHHHRPPGPARPASFVAPGAYPGSELVSQYPSSGHPGMPPYSPYVMPPYSPMPWAYPASSHPPSSAPPPREEKKDDGKIAEQFKALEALIAKQEEARLAAEKERIALAAVEAAGKERQRLEVEAEKRRKEDIAAAEKKAKETAEKKAEDAAKKAKDEHEAAVKKAKEEHEKKLKEAQTAKEEAEKKQKASEEEAAKLKPPPDSTLLPIKFKDALNRKFSFPFHLCKTWKGMELLIKQAFLHIEGMGEHVHAGHYDLTGPDGEIILPQVWDTMIKPDSEITMHLWPFEEDERKKDRLAAEAAGLASPYGMDLGDLTIVDMGKKPSSKHKDPNRKKNRTTSNAEVMMVGPSGVGPLPPPPPPGLHGHPLGIAGVVEDRKRPGKSGGKPLSKGVSPFQAWIAGGRVPAKKDDEKFVELVQHRNPTTTSVSAASSVSDQAACVVM